MPATWELADAAIADRKRLRVAGFVPIPATGKAAVMQGWQNIETVTDAEIESWFNTFPDSTNTGITTRSTPCVDIDVLDPEVAAEIEALLWDLIGSRAPVRFGLAPKRAILFRTGKPFAKISTPIFTSPNLQKHKVEVLGAGQQVICFGEHPGTKRPYSWFGGEPGNGITRADLPELSEAMAREFVAKAADIMRAHGWTEPAKTNGTGNGSADHVAGHGEFSFDLLYGDRERKYAATALQGMVDEISAMAPDSGRNSRLNALSFRAGTLAARGWIDRDTVAGRLLDAAAACRLVADDGESACRATIASGLGKGELAPAPDLADTNGAGTASAAAPLILDPLPFIDTSTWRVNVGVPPREWGVRDLFPRRNVALLGGEGAVGKTILMLQLGIAHALGRDWIGTLPEPGPFLYFGAEDETDEIHRRLADILKHYGADFPDLDGKLYLLTFAGEDAVLGHADHAGMVKPTQLYARLLKAASEIRPVLIGIDTSADVFSGNENDRTQVRQFVGLLRKLAMQANAYVLVNSHPSLTGINSGTGLSGSTGWHNSVRARAYMKATTFDKDDEPDPNLRTLEFKKSNYGPISRSIALHWHEGVYMPVASIGQLDRLAAEARADRLFLTLLGRFTKEGRNVNDKAAAKNFAPSAFAQEAEARKDGVRKTDFEGAMRRLFAAEKIVTVQYGAPCRGTTRLVAI